MEHTNTHVRTGVSERRLLRFAEGPKPNNSPEVQQPTPEGGSLEGTASVAQAEQERMHGAQEQIDQAAAQAPKSPGALENVWKGMDKLFGPSSIHEGTTEADLKTKKDKLDWDMAKAREALEKKDAPLFEKFAAVVTILSTLKEYVKSMFDKSLNQPLAAKESAAAAPAGKPSPRERVITQLNGPDMKGKPLPENIKALTQQKTKEKEQKQGELKKVGEGIEESKKQASDARTNKTNFENKRESLSDNSPDRITLDAQIRQADDMLKSIEKTIQGLEKNKADLTAAIDALDAELKELPNIQKDWESLKPVFADVAAVLKVTDVSLVKSIIPGDTQGGLTLVGVSKEFMEFAKGLIPADAIKVVNGETVINLSPSHIEGIRKAIEQRKTAK